jgi:hypothetical protein
MHAYTHDSRLIKRQLIVYIGQPPPRFGRMFKELRNVESIRDRLSLAQAYWHSHKIRGGWKKDSPASHRWGFLIAPFHDGAWPFFVVIFLKRILLTVGLTMTIQDVSA